MSAEETIISAKETIISGGETVTCRSFWVFIMKALFFAVIAVLTNFFYLKSLEHLLPATVSAIFASQSAFVYILSIVFLGETFLFLRVSVVHTSGVRKVPGLAFVKNIFTTGGQIFRRQFLLSLKNVI